MFMTFIRLPCLLLLFIWWWCYTWIDSHMCNWRKRPTLHKYVSATAGCYFILGWRVCVLFFSLNLLCLLLYLDGLCFVSGLFHTSWIVVAFVILFILFVWLHYAWARIIITTTHITSVSALDHLFGYVFHEGDIIIVCSFQFLFIISFIQLFCSPYDRNKHECQ